MGLSCAHCCVYAWLHDLETKELLLCVQGMRLACCWWTSPSGAHPAATCLSPGILSGKDMLQALVTCFSRAAAPGMLPAPGKQPAPLLLLAAEAVGSAPHMSSMLYFL